MECWSFEFIIIKIKVEERFRKDLKRIIIKYSIDNVDVLYRVFLIYYLFRIKEYLKGINL